MIYKLTRKTRSYDEFDGKIIRAKSEIEARCIANEHTGDEGRVWLDDKEVKCEVISENGPSGEILGSFCGG